MQLQPEITLPLSQTSDTLNTTVERSCGNSKCNATMSQYWYPVLVKVRGPPHRHHLPPFFFNQTGSTRVRVMFMSMEILCMLNLFTVSFDLHKEKIWVQDQEYNKFFHMVTKQTLSATPENPKQILNVIYLEILIYKDIAKSCIMSEDQNGINPNWISWKEGQNQLCICR